MNMSAYLEKMTRTAELAVWGIGALLWAGSVPFHHWNSTLQAMGVDCGILVLAGVSLLAIVNPTRRELYPRVFAIWFVCFGLAFAADTFLTPPDLLSACLFAAVIGAGGWAKMNYGRR